LGYRLGSARAGDRCARVELRRRCMIAHRAK
jgi:hypothetical protein